MGDLTEGMAATFRIALIVVGIVVFVAALLTLPVYLLWNWLMPKLFELPSITLLEALGLNLLAGFLFKSSCNCKK